MERMVYPFVYLMMVNVVASYPYIMSTQQV